MTMKCHDETDARCNMKVNRGESGRRSLRGVETPELRDLCYARICAPDAELIFSPPVRALPREARNRSLLYLAL